jgi:APA family basic amino acid/polyamine antiporter
MLAWLFGAEPSQYGWLGVISGASLVFFAFIGFDVVATSAEEVKDPQKTLPRGIFGGLALVTVLYILVTLALTGMVPIPSWPRPRTLAGHGLHQRGRQLGCPGDRRGRADGPDHRGHGAADGLGASCWPVRDGLLPRSWSVTSARRKTPVRLQLAGGRDRGVLAGFTKVELLEEMINIGTLSAFVLVSIGVLVLRKSVPTPEPATACLLCLCCLCSRPCCAFI